jgi:hypothetical protein
MPTQRRRKYRTIAGLAVYAAFLIAVVGWFVLYQFPRLSTVQARNPATDAADPEDHRGGTILLRSADGGCRQMKFDNSTGALQEGAVLLCTDGTRGTNSTEGRMSAIRDAFSKK